MIYIIDETNNNVLSVVEDLQTAHKYVEKFKVVNYVLAEKISAMKYISRITKVDDKVVYNSASFWLNEGHDILNDFEKHAVYDFLGQPVTKDRFEIELIENINRISSIDGRAGQIEYNMQVGNEFISIFREICILTDFKKESGVTPLSIAEKLSSVIALVQTGSFREAKMALQQIQHYQTDAFLTVERIQQFIDMLDAADVIEYATDEDYFYTIPEED